MAIRVKLRFRDKLTWDTERALFQKYGFHVVARKIGEYLLVERTIAGKAEAIPSGALPPAIVSELNRRISNICNMFKNYSEHPFTIGTRLMNITKTLPADQGMYIRGWLEEHLPEYDIPEGFERQQA